MLSLFIFLLMKQGQKSRPFFLKYFFLKTVFLNCQFIFQKAFENSNAWFFRFLAVFVNEESCETQKVYCGKIFLRVRRVQNFVRISNINVYFEFLQKFNHLFPKPFDKIAVYEHVFDGFCQSTKRASW